MGVEDFYDSVRSPDAGDENRLKFK